MAVSVLFPDGLRRDVSAELRVLSVATGRGLRFVQQPINADARWRYVRVDDRWHAVPRHPDIATLVPAAREWWQAIGLMHDTPGEDSRRKSAG
ncbi:hypothetical protein WG908_05055 [Sphingobium sp. AN641]|uniref:hypothetical protein n=1 Tax=Sphingobium sp. AN641 TaxID=3133443 RepID=UPI0030C0F87A